jgi:hypothetical protein
MPHDFQQYTSYQQSVELQRLGASQVVTQGSGARYFFKEGIGAEPQDMVWCGVTINFSTQIKFPEQSFVRRYSFQEMLYELMRHFAVELAPLWQGADHHVGYELSLVKPDTGNIRSDRIGQPNPVFICPCGLDPFSAVYRAFVWHLKQAKEAA